jgi:hypothetical protein
MKVIALLGGIVTGAVSLLHGCGCSHTEARQEEAGEWLQDRKAVLSESLMEAEAQAVPEGGGGAGRFGADIRKACLGATVLDVLSLRGSNQIERRIGRGVGTRHTEDDMVDWLNRVFAPAP